MFRIIEWSFFSAHEINISMDHRLVENGSIIFYIYAPFPNNCSIILYIKIRCSLFMGREKSYVDNIFFFLLLDRRVINDIFMFILTSKEYLHFHLFFSRRKNIIICKKKCTSMKIKSNQQSAIQKRKIFISQ